MPQNIFRMDFQKGELTPVQDAILQKKQIVFLNGYGQSLHSHQRLAIFDIIQEGDSLRYRLVNIDKPAAIQTTTAYQIRPVSEIFGIGLYYLPGQFATDEEILNGLDNVKVYEEQETNRKAKEKTDREKLIEHLLKEYSFLRKSNKEESSRITATKNIRYELNKAFPGFKFSVTSKSYSGGNSIDVDWTNGPTTEEINKIIQKYEYGSFDGQTDCYNYSHDPFNDLFGGVKYALTQRTITIDKYIDVAKELGYDIEIDSHFNFTGCNHEEKEIINRETWNHSFYIKPEKTVQVAEENISDTTLRINEEKNGIEIIFKEKPDTKILQQLKSHGFRWSSFNKLWYIKNTQENYEYAKSIICL